MTTPRFPDDLPERARIIRRAVLLRRYENALALASGRILTQVFADLEALLRKQPLSEVSPGRQAIRLQAIVRRAEEILRDGYRGLRQTSRAQLTELSRIAGESAVREVESRLVARGVDFSPLRLPTRDRFAALVTHDPIQGATLAEWWRGFEVGSRDRFRRAVQVGVARAETTDQIIRRVRGLVLRRAGGIAFQGGVFRLARNDAETLVRTAVHDVANAAALLSYRRNRDVVRGSEWLATLDDRTCTRCGSLDGERWALDDPKLRRPPDHPRCRCTTIPVLVGVTHPDRTTYDEWFADQSAALQDRVLGKTRGALYRQERMALADLIRSDGGLVTLEQLAARYPDAG